MKIDLRVNNLTQDHQAFIRLVQILILHHVEVVIGWDIPKEEQTSEPYYIAGTFKAPTWIGISSQTCLIGITEMLMVLAHEAGHWLDMHRNNILPELIPDHGAFREKQAYLCGWAILKHIDAPITKHQWQWHHAFNPELDVWHPKG